MPFALPLRPHAPRCRSDQRSLRRLAHVALERDVHQRRGRPVAHAERAEQPTDQPERARAEQHDGDPGVQCAAARRGGLRIGVCGTGARAGSDQGDVSEPDGDGAV